MEKRRHPTDTHLLLCYLVVNRILVIFLPLLIKFNLEKIPKALFLETVRQSLSWWDAHHFLYLAQHGYTNVGDAANYIVFQPLYPLLVNWLAFFTKDVFVASILISNICFIAGSFIFFKLLKVKYSQNTAITAILLMSLFPTSYFFSLPYSESLFLLLAAGSLYFMQFKNWLLAGVLIGLAVLTRHFGLILLPILIIEIWRQKPNHLIKTLILSLIPALLALGLYLALNYYLFGSFFAYLDILKTHWYKNPAWPWTGIVTSARFAIGGFELLNLTVGYTELTAAVVAWAFVFFGLKKLPLSYFLSYLSGVFLATATGFILSMPRYFLSLLPFFIVAGRLAKSKYLLYCWLGTSFALLITFATLYSLGQWAF